ncbi:MAG TPA: regulatory protein RecX, partial [Steroidobacteraceae bacterium]|nr:regulatory protein RecX [Steroidobacteraceae bacterium]
MRLLARRDFASGELSERLAQDGYPAETIAAVIADLTVGRIVDDARFAAQYVAYHADRGQGPRRIAMELGQRGVAQPLIEAALAAGPD